MEVTKTEIWFQSIPKLMSAVDVAHSRSILVLIQIFSFGLKFSILRIFLISAGKLFPDGDASDHEGLFVDGVLDSL